MSLITDFFVTSESGLLSITVGWLPVASYKMEMGLNPLTGETHLDWGPDPEALAKWEVSRNHQVDEDPQDKPIPGFFRRWSGKNAKKKDRCQTSTWIDYSNLNHAIYNQVDLIKLSNLYCLLGDIPFRRAFSEIEKPALMPADSQDEGLNRFSDDYTLELSQMDQDKLRRVASMWLETEEMRLDGFSGNDA